MDVIRKHTDGVRPPANLLDYETACAAFDWNAARAELSGLPGGRGLNIAHEAVDRHVLHGRGDTVALRWLDKAGMRRDFSYAQLAAQSNAFANVLRDVSAWRPANASSC